MKNNNTFNLQKSPKSPKSPDHYNTQYKIKIQPPILKRQRAFCLRDTFNDISYLKHHVK